MKSRGSDVKRQIGFSVVSLIASVLVSTLVPSWVGVTLPVPDKLALALLLFLVSHMLNVVHIVSKIASQQARERELWSIWEEGERDLSNIRACFSKLVSGSYGPRDLFVAHFRREFEELARLIHDAAQKNEVRVIAEHFLSVDNVLEAFREDDEPVMRYVWPIAAGDKLFDDHAWRSYFEATTKMARQKTIKWIRAILVVDSYELVKTPRLGALLSFFRGEKGLDCRLIREQDFKVLCSESRMPGAYLDFGIYGTRLLFRTEQYVPSIIGLFTKDPGLISQYTALFDRMWSSASITTANPSTPSAGTVSLEELLAADAEE